MRYDVIVVGAGPAGGLLAYHLANHGLKVLILEKDVLPRYKACGGGVTLKTIQHIPFDVSPVLERQVIGGILSFANQPLHRVTHEEPVAWMVMRKHFDHYLIRQAVAAGADLVDGIHVRDVEQDERSVRVHTSGGIYNSVLLAGADGVNSQVAKSSGLIIRRRTGVAIEAELEVPTAAMEAQSSFATFDFGVLSEGYAWIFPKREHLSVGVFQTNSSKASNLTECLLDFINHQSVLKDYQGMSQRGHRVPLGGVPQQLHESRILLVGDAANLADPWFGEGIYYAVISAREAARVMIDFMESESNDLSQYTHWINNQLMQQFREAQRIAHFVYHFPKFCSTALRRSPFVFEAIFTLLRGEIDFKQLTRSLVGRSPRIFYEMIFG
jgi:geranylgeranyl reductase family protein